MSPQDRSFLRRQSGIRVVAGIVISVVAGIAIWGFVEGQHEAALEAEREQPTGAGLQVSERNGETVITIDRATRQQSGIETATAAPVSYSEQQKAYGKVLDLSRFNDLANTVANAKAQLQTVQARVAATHASYQRSQLLFKENQNVSAAQFQAAEAAFRADEAAENAADMALRTALAGASQEFGATLGSALLDSSPLVGQLLQRQMLLIQVTLPSGAMLSAPPTTGSALSADGRRILIQLVSPAARTDPKIQGISFFYTVPAQSGLLPGMSVAALLPTGETVAGAVVPRTAVVWLQGQAWVYLKVASDTFVRHAIETDLPTPDSYVVRALPGDRQLVVQGPQSLLSEEFRGQIRAGEGGT